MSILGLSDTLVQSKCIECGVATPPAAKFCGECGATQTAMPSAEQQHAAAIPTLGYVQPSTSQWKLRGRSLIWGVLIAVTASAAAMWSQHEHAEIADNQPQTAARNSASSDSSDNAVRELISKDSQFTICRVRELEFARDPSVGKESVDPNDLDSQNDSLFRYRPVLVLLRKAGYVDGGTTKFSGGVPPPDGGGGVIGDMPTDIFWFPSKKGRAAIGNEIREVMAGRYANGWVGYKWTLVLGCRSLERVDATTPLGDGLKVDFSWQWKQTDLGAADGLTNERQRGVAYLVRKGTGFAVDRIQIDSGIGR
jgi:hypothetical protein